MFSIAHMLTVSGADCLIVFRCKHADRIRCGQAACTRAAKMKYCPVQIENLVNLQQNYAFFVYVLYVNIV